MTISSTRVLGSVFLVSILLVSLQATAERKLILTEENITVEEDAEGDRVIPKLFGTTTMKATPERIAEWIGAVHTYTTWQHNCEEARVLVQPDGSSLTYNRIASPWPVSDRDVVLRSTRSQGDEGRIRVEFRNPNAPQDTGAVRMPRLEGSYDLTPVDGGTRVVYTLDSNPGGSLPNWLVRQAAKELPFLTLRNLRERAESGPPPQP